MGLFKKKSDPISNRSKALSAQIASLEAEIRRLDTKVQRTAAQPRVRSTALPYGQAQWANKKAKAAPRDPVFESVDHRHLDAVAETDSTAEHFNDLGVRKYDIAAAWRRFRSQFRGPPANNPKLVSYLAAGSIRGLRPLRYEKRIARNRFIALFIILVCLLWGIIAVFVRSQ
ncbi:MAG: hypothetical protein U1G07_05995 [Verrucomicrobiota bacterium]